MLILTWNEEWSLKPSSPQGRCTRCRSWVCRCVRTSPRAFGPGTKPPPPHTDRCCSWPLLALWPPTWWPSPDRRRSLPGAGAVKAWSEGTSKDTLAVRRLAGPEGVGLRTGAAQRILEPLTAPRGGLILPRRVKATPQYKPVPYRATDRRLDTRQRCNLLICRFPCGRPAPFGSLHNLGRIRGCCSCESTES